MAEKKRMGHETMAAAMVAAYGEIEAIAREREGQVGRRTFSYVGLEQMHDALRPILARHGLGVLQVPVQRFEDNVLMVGCRTTIYHESGESESYECVFAAGNADAQAQGSLITYARRYSYPFAVAADEEQNAEAAMKGASQASRIGQSRSSSGSGGRGGGRGNFMGDAPEDQRISEGKLRRLHAIAEEVVGGDAEKSRALAEQLREKFGVTTSAHIHWRIYDDVIEWIRGWPHEAVDAGSGGAPNDEPPIESYDDDIPF